MAFPEYHEVKWVKKLPRKTTRDERYVTHGYAARIGNSNWFFFEHFEPALVFGRAARMSLQISSYGVHEAAHEVRFVSSVGDDQQTLHVLDGAGLDRAPGEMESLLRWVRGVDPASAHWNPKAGDRT
jgi:hypothetical protein